MAKHVASFALALKSGVTMAAGSDNAYHAGKHRRLRRARHRRRARDVAEAGARSPRRSAGAALLGFEKLGTLAPGMEGDFIAIDGDPLADIHAHRARAARRVQGEDRHRQDEMTEKSAMSSLHRRWDDVQAEQINSAISRRFITGDRVTVARFELQLGGIVPMHSHESEQVTMVLSGALQVHGGRRGDCRPRRRGDAVARRPPARSRGARRHRRGRCVQPRPAGLDRRDGHLFPAVAVLKFKVPAPPAGVAQLVEQLIRNQQVVGSSPIAGSRITLESIDVAKSVLLRRSRYSTDSGRPGDLQRPAARRLDTARLAPTWAAWRSLTTSRQAS